MSQKGRLVVIRYTFIFLTLFMAALILNVQFRALLFKNAANIYMFMAYTNTDPAKFTKDYVRTFALYNMKYTDEIASLCTFPKVNPYDKSLMRIAGLDKKTIDCEGESMPDLTYIEGGNQLKVNTSQVNKYIANNDFKECRYRSIYRHDTDDNDYKYSEWSNPFNESMKLPENAEFLQVNCTNKKYELVSKNFFALISRKEQFDEIDYLNLKKRQAMFAPKETLNIIMIGMDSLTRNHFLRACNKSYTYLMNSLNSFDLTMHSQLGGGTFPNFLPFFAGQSEDNIKKWWSDKHHLDNIDFLFGTFESAGYRTLYTEDCPVWGAFHYFKKGFKLPFARYNTRPLTLAMSHEKNFWTHKKYCAGNQVEVNFLLEHVFRFIESCRDNPVFAVAMFTKPAHDDPTDAKMFDEHLLNFYETLNQTGHLNKSLLVSFSDHGLRLGELRNSKYGIFESKTPYTILTFPDWFLRKYPDVAANLKVNTRRLTSHFDTHATLLDLLYFKSISTPPVAPLRHGISLFENIPWNRTCQDASIPPEFCLCGYKSIEEVDSNSQISNTLADLVIDALNSKSDKNICAVFKLYKVIAILKISLYEANSNGDSTLYKVKLEVAPGNATFEASVYAKTNSTHFKVANSIDRLSMYRGQADCMHIAMYQPFCYCKNLLPKEENVQQESERVKRSIE